MSQSDIVHSNLVRTAIGTFTAISGSIGSVVHLWDKIVAASPAGSRRLLEGCKRPGRSLNASVCDHPNASYACQFFIMGGSRASLLPAFPPASAILIGVAFSERPQRRGRR